MSRDDLISEFLTLAADFFDKATALLADFRENHVPKKPRKTKKQPAHKTYTKSAYQLYADSRFPALTETASMAEKAKSIGTEWRQLPEEEKEKWRKEAKRLKDGHKQMPGSATSPVPVSDSEA